MINETQLKIKIMLHIRNVTYNLKTSFMLKATPPFHLNENKSIFRRVHISVEPFGRI